MRGERVRVRDKELERKTHTHTHTHTHTRTQMEVIGLSPLYRHANELLRQHPVGNSSGNYKYVPWSSP